MLEMTLLRSFILKRGTQSCSATARRLEFRFSPMVGNRAERHLLEFFNDIGAKRK
jgi:hypothetical protein